MIHTPWFARSLPFGIYLLFILIRQVAEKYAPSHLAEYTVPVLYPVGILCVAAALIYYWRSYEELRLEKIRTLPLLEASAAGILVFLLWINMEWDFAVMGDAKAYDPTVLAPAAFYAFIAVRMAGTAVVVPIFEELFWRSFIMRYIIDPDDFTRVPIGAFTWPSFLITALLFGAEHHLWLAGIVAGMIYAFLLYRTRHLFYPILAHGITNLLLGIYVIYTGAWRFW